MSFSTPVHTAEVITYLRNALAEDLVPARLIDECVPRWRELCSDAGGERTIRTVLPDLLAWCRERMAPEEILDTRIVSMSDRDLLVALYRKLCV